MITCNDYVKNLTYMYIVLFPFIYLITYNTDVVRTQSDDTHASYHYKSTCFYIVLLLFVVVIATTLTLLEAEEITCEYRCLIATSSEIVCTIIIITWTLSRRVVTPRLGLREMIPKHDPTGLCLLFHTLTGCICLRFWLNWQVKISLPRAFSRNINSPTS